MPFPLVTTFETAGTYKKWCGLTPPTLRICGMRYFASRTSIHTYIYIYIRTAPARQLFLVVELIILRLFYVSLTGVNGKRLTCSLPTASNTTTERKYERRTTHTHTHTHTQKKQPPKKSQPHPLTFLHLRYQLGWLIKKYYCTVTII